MTEIKIIVKPGCDLITDIAGSLKAELQALVKTLPQELTLDLSGVEMIDSIGIGIIIATYNSMQKIGGNFRIINITKNIQELFIAANLHNHFYIELSN